MDTKFFNPYIAWFYDKRILKEFEELKKLFLRIFCISLIADAILCGWIAYKMNCDPQWLVDLKYSLFTDFTRNREIFVRPLDVLESTGFKTDLPESINQWSFLIRSEVEYAKGININVSSTPAIQKAKSIVLLFSKNGGSVCLDDLRLLAKLQKLAEGSGNGCCTDHTQAFIALSTILGLNSREVHTVADTFINGHVTNEFFDHGLNKWIWIDPFFALLAKNQYGEYLSLMEIRQTYYNGVKVIYEFFGNNYHYFKNKEPYETFYFQNEKRFSDIMLTWGNNVFGEDRFNRNLGFLPEPIRQFVGLSIGILPSYKMYVDDKSLKAHFLIRSKYIFMGLFALLVSGTLLHPFSGIIRLLMKRKR